MNTLLFEFDDLEICSLLNLQILVNFLRLNATFFEQNFFVRCLIVDNTLIQ